MNEHSLENVMLSFINGENNVLVATTIIESGIDIPNANTMIIMDSDRYGLSQLYQLRGRVWPFQSTGVCISDVSKRQGSDRSGRKKAKSYPGIYRVWSRL